MNSHRLHAAGVLFFCFLLGMTGRGLFDSFVVMLRPLDQSHDWTAINSRRSMPLP